jgi:hypothetical protein
LWSPYLHILTLSRVLLFDSLLYRLLFIPYGCQHTDMVLRKTLYVSLCFMLSSILSDCPRSKFLAFYKTKLMNALHISPYYLHDCLALNSYDFTFLSQMMLYRLRSDFVPYRTREKMQNRVSEMCSFVRQFTSFVSSNLCPLPLASLFPILSHLLQLVAYEVLQGSECRCLL